MAATQIIATGMNTASTTRMNHAAPPAPPIESLGYSLKGVVSDGASRWAIVSHPTGEALLKVGDPLGEAYTVTAIDVQGLWGVSSPGAEPQLLGFAK